MEGWEHQSVNRLPLKDREVDAAQRSVITALAAALGEWRSRIHGCSLQAVQMSGESACLFARHVLGPIVGLHFHSDGKRRMGGYPRRNLFGSQQELLGRHD